MKEGHLYYLATPYSHENKDVMEERFHQVTAAAGKLLNMGYVIYSPITHGRPIAQATKLPHHWEFWERLDRVMLSRADGLIVLNLPGWDTSVGVTAEIQIAAEFQLPVHHLSPDFGDTHDLPGFPK